MSEMIERIARVSFDAWNKQRGRSFAYEDMSEEEREWSMVHAKAILEAMRVPTEGMIKAGTISWDPMDGSPIRPVFDPTKPYQAMIDEALK